MKLHRYYNEYHIIATRAQDNELLSIPIDSNIDFEVVDLSVRDLGSMLPAIFSRTNVTWDVSDVTQARISEGLRSVPQPMEGVFEEWARNYEGKWIKINYDSFTVILLFCD